MFYGEYYHAIDKKGRVIIPAKLRETLKKLDKNKFVITRGLEKSLFIFSLSEWKVQEEKLRTISLNKNKPMVFSRILFSGAYQCSLDRQGRISLPRSLVQYADIKKEVVIIGVSNRIEIWDRFTWEDYINKSKYSFIEFARNFIYERNVETIGSK